MYSCMYLYMYCVAAVQYDGYDGGNLSELSCVLYLSIFRKRSGAKAGKQVGESEKRRNARSAEEPVAD